MSQKLQYAELFDRSLDAFFKDALRVSLGDPAMAWQLVKTLRNGRRAKRTRACWEARGVHVPAFVIASITKRCNLHCKGCYARAQYRPEAEMSAERLGAVVDEAEELGVSIMLIAGGEPLTRPEILDITRQHPRMVFPLFTNGLLLDDATIARLRKQRQVVPVLSLEGHQIETDNRRGAGVYGHVLDTMERLVAEGIFFGTSLTVTRENYPLVANEGFLREMLARGCRLFFLVEYVPIQEGTEFLVLTEEQREALPALLATWRQELPGLFVALPGDEEMFGGCLAAGRGFVHISPEGHLEPCPFAPFSDVSLKTMSLREALQSELLAKIRTSPQHMTETQGGCALWANRHWVQSLLQRA
ncbi:MAG: radical SAM protein [Anaerolineae bacterium]|nr:radical SAM protein [Anaerolineae bacterium]